MLVRKIIGGVLIVGILAAALAAGLSYNPVQSAANEPARFNSYEELVNYIGSSTKMAEQFNILFGHRGAMLTGSADMAQSGSRMKQMENTVAQDSGRAVQESTTAPDYSSTNTQVQGVDEADLVKTDGNYLYVISGSELFIIKAHPANSAVKLATLKFTGQPSEAFINGDTLVVFGNGPDPQTMFINKYNISDRTKPVLTQVNKCDGYYVNSRMIGENIYAVISTPVYRHGVNDSASKITLPRITTNGQVRTVPATEIHFFPN
ncbi:MAG: beta-propeller domain-containing protein, partial [Desulfotomaculaceae bacterium]